MLIVEKIKSEIFTSNAYLLTSSNKEEVFLIDCGAFEPVLDKFPEHYDLKGIFITHFHYDHIYFIKEWIERFPNVVIYCSEITKEGIASSKRNLSFYHDDPVEFDIASCQILKEGDNIRLFDGIYLFVLKTEGHCEGSLSFKMGDYIFTGDALIPNIPVVTKLKSGNKVLAKESVLKIKSHADEHTIICPGHMEPIKAKDVLWDIY